MIVLSVFECSAEIAIKALEKFSGRCLEPGYRTQLEYSMQDNTLKVGKVAACTHLTINGDTCPLFEPCALEEIQSWLLNKGGIMK